MLNFYHLNTELPPYVFMYAVNLDKEFYTILNIWVGIKPIPFFNVLKKNYLLYQQIPLTVLKMQNCNVYKKLYIYF